MLGDLSFLRDLRRQEIAAVAGDLPPASRVLDLGAGTGTQARRLAELGHRVTALDVESSRYLEHAEYPVEVYDGRTLPFPDDSFDVVFSSNVLEHVHGLDALLGETQRVLTPGGRAIHVLPTAAWRWWTSLAHYPWLLTGRWRVKAESGEGGVASRHPWLRRLRLAVASPRHGEDGTVLWELYGFSRFRWRRQFRRTGFRVVDSRPVGLFYTGYTLLGLRLSHAARARLARWLGSATRIFVLRAD